MGSLRKMFTETLISIEDLSYLSRLLETNLSLNDCLDLLKNRRNQTIFETLRKRLDKGEAIETAIRDFLPREIRPYVLSLLGSLSFTDTLSLSLAFCRKHAEGKNSLLASIAYPCILLFITITSLYLFDLYGIDAIFDLIGSFNADIGLYQDIRVLFRILVQLIYYGFMLGTLLLIYLLQPKRIVVSYLFLSRHFPNSLFTIYYSEEFMSLFLVCLNMGFKTKEALEVLKGMKSKPIVSFLAFHLDESLLEGETLKDAIRKNYYDSSLSRFIKIAGYTNDFAGIIASYTGLAQEKVRKKLKRYSLTIQMLTYLFIGAVIIFIYQILFMPMQAISMY